MTILEVDEGTKETPKGSQYLKSMPNTEDFLPDLGTKDAVLDAFMKDILGGGGGAGGLFGDVAALPGAATPGGIDGSGGIVPGSASELVPGAFVPEENAAAGAPLGAAGAMAGGSATNVGKTAADSGGKTGAEGGKTWLDERGQTGSHDDSHPKDGDAGVETKGHDEAPYPDFGPPSDGDGGGSGSTSGSTSSSGKSTSSGKSSSQSTGDEEAGCGFATGPGSVTTPYKGDKGLKDWNKPAAFTRIRTATCTTRRRPPQARRVTRSSIRSCPTEPRASSTRISTTSAARR